MVTLRTSPLLAASLLVASLGCQTLAGIEDKELDPALGASGSGGSGGTSGSAGQEAGTDAPSDVTADVADTGGDVSDAGAGTRPPGRPPGDAAPSGSSQPLTFAVRRFYLGTVDPETDSFDVGAWRQFGFDYDGECTTLAQSENNASSTCKLPSDAKNKQSLEDGHECRDNIGGHLLAEVLTFADQSFEKKVHNGTWNATDPTIILQILDLDSGPDDPYAPGRIYVTAPKTGGMLWDGEDMLQVDVDSLVDGGLEASKYEMPNGYMRDNVWVSGDFMGPPVIVPMMVLDRIAPVPTRTSVLVVKMDEDHSVATDAMFAGVLDTLSLEPLLRIGMLEATDCNEALADIGMSMFLPHRDLADDTDFVDGTAECGLMSLATGLELKRVQAPQSAVVVPPLPSSCDGGTG